MKILKLQNKIRTSLLFITALFFIAQISFAATGIGLRPLRTDISVNPGETENIILTVINNENFAQTVMPEFQTYTSHNEKGFPIAKKMEDNDPENIISWIDFGDQAILVDANSEKKITIKVTVPEDAEPGGRYGALIYGPIISNTSGVSIRTRVASLLLLNVKGEEKYDGDVYNFSLDELKMYSDKGINFAVNFENKGNVHVNPKGTISVFNDKNEKVLNIFSIVDKNGNKVLLNDIPVNPYLNYVLPGLKRNYKSNWQENIKEGVYEAKLNFIFKQGKANKTIEKGIKFEIKDELISESFELVEEDSKTYAILKIQNNGTVYEKLVGEINVLNNFDFKIGEIKIPNDIDYIAPGELKEFKIKFLDKRMPKGDYTIKSNVKYGYEHKILEFTSSVSFVNNIWLFIGGGLLLLLILGFLWKKRKDKKENLVK